MDSQQQYELLRNLTSPVMAITSSINGSPNGMIANSAIRASLVPEIPRVSFYCFKQHYSHEVIAETGRFCIHFLHRGQLDVVGALGFESGRDVDKFAELEWHMNEHGLPVIEDSYAWLSCDVVNAMDAGPSTFFLGDTVETSSSELQENRTILDNEFFRENMPEDWKVLYRENKKRVQDWARDHAEVDPSRTWPFDHG